MSMNNPLRTEPAAIVGVIQALVGLGIVMGWWNLTDVQQGALVSFIGLTGALFVRQSVVAVSTARERMDRGLDPTRTESEQV